MKRLYLILFLLIFNIGFSQEYYVYVAAESDDQVSVLKFDGKEIQETDRVSVGVMPTENEGPHGITIDPNGKYWYLTLAHGNPNGSVVKYSTENNEPLSKVELGLFPATMQISKTTGLLYVVNFNLHGLMKTSTVSVVDPVTMTEITTITTGSMPHGSRILNNGLKHYSVAMMSGMLYEIDAMSMEVSRTLQTSPPMKMKKGKHSSHSMHSMHNSKKMDHGHKNDNKAMGKMAMDHKMPPEKPTWVYPHPNDDLLYVVNNGTDNVVEVDVKEWKVNRIFKTDKGPYNCEVSRDGKYMVVTYKSAAKTGVWDLKKGKEVAKFNNSRKNY